MNVSVIVPIYHGEQYVTAILEQIKRNAEYAPNHKLELLLYNDCPEECIRVDEGAYAFAVRVVNADRNAGIHGARVNALKQAVGEYILFLDQDDVIRDNYIESQCQKIGDADAVVCRLINGKRMHYTDSFRFEEVITKEFMLKNWCPIVSPGQVLLRKEAVPDIWKENILENNGADDYFLWLCMMAEEKRFALNQEVLFEHVITGHNTSENTNLMMDSEEEMIRILEREAVFGERDQTMFDVLRSSLRNIHVKQLDTQRNALNCLNRLYADLLKKGYICDWMKKHRDKRIAIYGAGELGTGLYELLKNQGLNTVCYLDQNAKFIMSEIPVYTLKEADIKLDSILLTIPDKSLYESLKCKFNCEVVDVRNVHLE